MNDSIRVSRKMNNSQTRERSSSKNGYKNFEDSPNDKSSTIFRVIGSPSGTFHLNSILSPVSLAYNEDDSIRKNSSIDERALLSFRSSNNPSPVKKSLKQKEVHAPAIVSLSNTSTFYSLGL